ncbi:hypothetical protein HYY71_01580 [Candidatus Woesearchaeota archaeon]|nr:hypothetical protein [Candidatus Woesearchaeota archaeon]
MNSDKINIWDLGNKINIKVTDNFIDLINSKIKEKYGAKRNAHKELIRYYNIPFSTFKVRMKRGYKYFIDLDILLNLCKILNIPINDLQKNVIAYKSRKGSNYIENPKLPIEITPMFDMLIAHHMADGGVINPKNGRKKYFGYRQFNDNFRELYIKKFESLIGKIKFNKDYIKDSTRAYCPTVITNLFFSYYNLKEEDYLTEKSFIPKEIKEKGKENLLVVLIAFIIDEGHVDSTLITIGLKNKRLIEDLQDICKKLGYESINKERKKQGLFYIYILSEGVKKLYNDYKELKKSYPEVSLGIKEDKVKNIVDINKKVKIFLKGNKEKIIDLLLENNYSANEIAKMLSTTRQGSGYLMRELLKEGKIEVKGYGYKNTIIYGSKVI